MNNYNVTITTDNLRVAIAALTEVLADPNMDSFEDRVFFLETRGAIIDLHDQLNRFNAG